MLTEGRDRNGWSVLPIGGPRGHAHHEGNAQGVFVDPAGGAEVRVGLSSGQRWPNVRADGGREDERAEEEAT